MNYERINTALQKATDTREVVIGAGVINSVNEIYVKCFQNQPVVVVADENTFKVAGQEVDQHLRAAGRTVLEPYIFPGQPMLYADYQNVLKLAAALQTHQAIPVVTGSGTLNDITKLASHQADRPYMVVATAASMDGYTAFGAAITRDGFKQTMACPAPYAVVADLNILANAPLAMTASGYADLLGKVTAGADWLIADAVGAEAINSYAWSLVQDSLRRWTASPHRLAQGDKRAFEYLIEGLILTGLAMQAYQSSRCASGSEHQFSHLWEMEGVGHGDQWISHGFKVGIGSIASAALYERFLQRDFSSLNIPAICRAWPSRAEVEQRVKEIFINPEMAKNAVKESLVKYIGAEELAERLTRLGQCWPELRQKLQDQLMPAAELRKLLEAVGSFTDPAQLEVDRQRLKASYFRAYQIRRRYTVFDLAAESGCFEECVAELFAPGGFWADGR